MNNFEFYNPTRIVFGSNEINTVGKHTVKYGKKALIVTTRGSVKKLGIFDKVKSLLEKEGIETVELSGVDPNPRLSTVYQGVQICRKENVDVIVAVGGGSVIDCSKAIAFAVFDDGDLWDFFACKRTAQKGLPILTVLTLTGTGSEMNTNCVITNEKLDQKYSTHYAFSFPKVSIIDPELQKTVPNYLTACGMTDTISHVMEKYFDGTKDTPIQDRIAEGIILTVIENEEVLNQPENVTMRANLSWAATMALNGLNDAGRGSNDYDAHTIEMEASAKFDIAHGAGLAVVHPAWLQNLCKKNPEKFVQFAERIFGIEKADKSDVELGLAGIEALKNKFKQWGMPITFKEAGIPKEALEGLALTATQAPEGSYLDKDEIYNVLLSCYE